MTDHSPGSVLRADHEAADWFVAHDRGLTDAEWTRFEAWRHGSPTNEEAWHHAQTLMLAYPAVSDDRLVDLRNAALTMRPPVWKRLPVAWVAVAAAVLLFVGTASWNQLGLLTGHPGTPAEVALAPSHYTAEAKSVELALNDGSHIQLDAHSKLNVAMQRSRRDLDLLAGRAFFSVAHDVTRPFVVAAVGQTVTATGTAFSVSVEGDQLRVVLQTGHVRISPAKAGDPPVNLNPGQEYRVVNGEGQVRSVSLDTSLAWREGVIDLKDTPVSAALEEMNRHSGVKVAIADPAAGALRVTGQFPYDDAPAFAEAVSAMYPVHVEHRGGEPVLASNRH